METQNPFASKTVKNKSVVSQIVNEITDAIIVGTLKPGDRLPSEVELCQSFKVGRNSVREAIKILEAYGVLYIKRPDGTFINDTNHEKMLDPMLYGILLQKNFAEDIVNLRKVLDIGIMQLIINNISQEAFDEIKTANKNLQKVLKLKKKDPLKILQADLEFHMAIAKAANNNLLLSMYTYVDRITIPSRLHATKTMIEEEKVNDFIFLHDEIIDMIEHSNISHIEKTIREHYTFWEKTI